MSRIKPENKAAYFEEHPPKSIADFLVQTALLSNIEFDGHGFSGRYTDGLVAKQNIIFALKCQCGNVAHSIIAESEREEIWRHKNLVIAERYFLECSVCHSRHLFFDPSLHGYNAELFQMEGLNLHDDTEGNRLIQKSEKVICECSNCKRTEFEVFARFEYSANLFDMQDFEGKEQEFFSWFTGIGKCSTCSTVNMFIDYECA